MTVRASAVFLALACALASLVGAPRSAVPARTKVPLTSASNPLRLDPVGTTTQPVSGSATARQGAAALLSGAWPVRVTSGTTVLSIAFRALASDVRVWTTTSGAALPVNGVQVVTGAGTVGNATAFNNLGVLSNLAWFDAICPPAAGQAPLATAGVVNNTYATMLGTANGNKFPEEGMAVTAGGCLAWTRSLVNGYSAVAGPAGTYTALSH